MKKRGVMGIFVLIAFVAILILTSFYINMTGWNVFEGNLIDNGDFSEEFSGWEVSGENVEVINEEYEVLSIYGYGYAYQRFESVLGGRYRLTFDSMGTGDPQGIVPKVIIQKIDPSGWVSVEEWNIDSNDWNSGYKEYGVDPFVFEFEISEEGDYQLVLSTSLSDQGNNNWAFFDNIGLEYLGGGNEPVQDFGELRFERLEDDKDLISAIGGEVPGKCRPFVDSETGVRITRMTDIADVKNYYDNNNNVGIYDSSKKDFSEYNGFMTLGQTNGYSKMSSVNSGEEYMLTFRNEGSAGLYGIGNCKFLGNVVYSREDGFSIPLNFGNDVRWSRVPGEEEVIYYVVAGKVYKQNVLEGVESQEFIGEPIYNGIPLGYSGGEWDFGAGGRYMPVRLDGSITYVGVYDVIDRELIVVAQQRPNAIDISPDGKWFAILPHYKLTQDETNRFYKISDLEVGDLSNPVYVPSVSAIGHNGWSYNKDGNLIFVYQDNGDDWFKSFDLETGEVIKIFSFDDIGGYDVGFGQHMAALENTPGWMQVSTYDNNKDVNSWTDNQIFFVEITDRSENPRLLRVGHTQNIYPYWLGKNDAYFAEGFVNADRTGKNLYVGANWNGEDNLEVYRIELPENWNDIQLGKEESNGDKGLIAKVGNFFKGLFD